MTGSSAGYPEEVVYEACTLSQPVTAKGVGKEQEERLTRTSRLKGLAVLVCSLAFAQFEVRPAQAATFTLRKARSCGESTVADDPGLALPAERSRDAQDVCTTRTPKILSENTNLSGDQPRVWKFGVK